MKNLICCSIYFASFLHSPLGLSQAKENKTQKDFDRYFYRYSLQYDTMVRLNKTDDKCPNDFHHDAILDYNVKTKSEAYKDSMKNYENQQSVVRDVLAFRGDSRFPWKVWEKGGFWPKGTSQSYSAYLHQTSPSSQQSIVSTFSQMGSTVRYATAFGLFDELFIPSIHKPDLNPEKTWSLNKGYIYVVKIKEGISLEKLNKKAPAYSYQKTMQKRYNWEKEIAVLEGIPRKNILAAREMVIDKTSSTYKNKFTDKIFIRKDMFLPTNHNNLIYILENLGQIKKSSLKTMMVMTP